MWASVPRRTCFARCGRRGTSVPRRGRRPWWSTGRRSSAPPQVPFWSAGRPYWRYTARWSFWNPPLLAFCARIVWGGREQKRLARDIARLRGKDPEQRGQICTGCIHALAEGSRSLLIGDLFTSLGIYTRIPLFRGRERFVELVAERGGFPSVAWAMESLLTRDADEITARFGAVFRTVTSAVQAYLDEMSRTFGGAGGPLPRGLTGRRSGGGDHYYMQVTQDLIDKIGTGSTLPGPSCPRRWRFRTLTASVATVRRCPC